VGVRNGTSYETLVPKHLDMGCGASTGGGGAPPQPEDAEPETREAEPEAGKPAPTAHQPENASGASLSPATTEQDCAPKNPEGSEADPFRTREEPESSEPVPPSNGASSDAGSSATQHLAQEAERIAASRKVDKRADSMFVLEDDLKKRRDDITGKLAAVCNNDGLAAAAELARGLFPDAFALVDDACGEIALQITEGLGELFKLAPPPLNTALGPLGRMCGAVVDQARLVHANREAAKKLAERVVEAARTIGELLWCIDKNTTASSSMIRDDVVKLTQVSVPSTPLPTTCHDF
jgi:hypothetical protein